MKNFFVVLVMLMLLVVKGWAIQKDVIPAYGTSEWKAYVQADKYAKEARAKGNYLSQAEKTPFSWVAGWAYFNAAKKVWATDSTKAEERLKLAESSRDAAIKANIYPTKGDSSMDNLTKAIEKIRKAMKENAKVAEPSEPLSNDGGDSVTSEAQDKVKK